MTALDRFRLALLLLVLVALGGMAGYVVVDGQEPAHALYMAILSLGAVSEVSTQTAGGHTVTALVVVAGIACTALVAGTFAEVIVGAQLQFVLGRRRMERELGRLKDHYIVCGYGRMGQELVDQFTRRGADVVVIELCEDRARELRETGMRVVTGDAADDQTLRAAGIERARALITVAPRDADNIFITLSARALNPELLIVARSIYDQDVKKLELAGADRVISPYVIGARRIAAAVFEPSVVEFLDFEVNRGELEWELADIPIGGSSPLCGKTLRNSEIRANTGCTVLALRNPGMAGFHSNPAPDTPLSENATMVVLGTPRQIEKLERMAGLAPGERRAVRRRRRGLGLLRRRQ